MNCFQSERTEGTHGQACAALGEITSKSFIALDSEGHCEAEWIQCAGGKPPIALKDWIADMLVAEKIRLYSMSVGSVYNELNKLGVPKKDHKWVRLARSVPSTAIVTEDIDLFDPAKKQNCTANAKVAIKAAKSGPVAKYLRKSYSIDVMCIQHVIEYIEGALAA
jgi:hypothetical protein